MARKFVENGVEIPVDVADGVFNFLTFRNNKSLLRRAERRRSKQEQWLKKEDERLRLLLTDQINNLNRVYGFSSDNTKEFKKMLMCHQCDTNFGEYLSDIANAQEKLKSQKGCYCSAWNDCKDKKCKCPRTLATFQTF